MQHYIQFALLLMLATAHLTSPAVSTVSSLCINRNRAYTLLTLGRDHNSHVHYTPGRGKIVPCNVSN